jgi:hypothetical protein
MYFRGRLLPVTDTRSWSPSPSPNFGVEHGKVPAVGKLVPTVDKLSPSTLNPSLRAGGAARPQARALDVFQP